MILGKLIHTVIFQIGKMEDINFEYNMDESCQDHSLIQDFEDDFPQKVPQKVILKILN